MSTVFTVARDILAVIGGFTVLLLGALLTWSALQYRHKHDAKAAWERAAAKKFGEG